MGQLQAWLRALALALALVAAAPRGVAGIPARAAGREDAGGAWGGRHPEAAEVLSVRFSRCALHALRRVQTSRASPTRRTRAADHRVLTQIASVLRRLRKRLERESREARQRGRLDVALECEEEVGQVCIRNTLLHTHARPLARTHARSLTRRHTHARARTHMAR